LKGDGNMAIRLRMDLKEVAEARRAQIPENIIGKMINGLELSDKEKDIVKSRGKVYVLAHTKERGKIKINPQLRNLPVGKRVMVRSSNNSNNEEDLAEALAKELGVEVVKEHDSPFGRGKVVELDDGSEVLVFENSDDAEKEAIERVREDLEYDPEMFTQSWLQDFVYISDTDRRVMASEEVDSYVSDIKDSEPDRLIEEADMDIDEYEEASEKRKEEMLNEADEILSEQMYNDWYKSLVHPIDFLVDEQGLYSKEDLMKQPWIQLDIDKASKDAIRVDGVPHFLATYDGEENYGRGEMVYYYLDKP